MLRVFKFLNYRDFIRFRIETHPDGRHGQVGKIAKFLGVQSSMLSQVMAGKRNLSLEAASRLCSYFGLTELEADYLLNLVELDRAGTQDLRDRIQRRLSLMRERAQQVSEVLTDKAELSEVDKGRYYSQWYYGAVRLCTSLPKMSSANDIARSLNVPPALVVEVLEFLVERGLCRDVGERLMMSSKRVFLAKSSPFINRHHQNWRQRAMQSMEVLAPHELLFTSPVALSFEAFNEIKALLLDFIKDWDRIVGPSTEETIGILNIDWLDLLKGPIGAPS